jgi:hypothetical protein
MTLVDIAYCTRDAFPTYPFSSRSVMEDSRPDAQTVIRRVDGAVTVTCKGDLGAEDLQWLRYVLDDLVDGQGNLTISLAFPDLETIRLEVCEVVAEVATRLSSRGGRLSVTTDNARWTSSYLQFVLIYRDQPAVSEEGFWRCVDDGVLPPRPEPPSAIAEGDAFEAKLVRNLIRRVGLTEAEIATFTKAEAVARWEQYLSEGGT